MLCPETVAPAGTKAAHITHKSDVALCMHDLYVYLGPGTWAN